MCLIAKQAVQLDLIYEGAVKENKLMRFANMIYIASPINTKVNAQKYVYRIESISKYI